MNKSIVLALAAAGTLLTAGAAHAANVSRSVGINLPVPGLVITGGPVYQQPGRYYQSAPVYAPEPVYYAPESVYYAPESVYYAPEPVYYPRYPQWRHHYRPAPVVVEVPRYQPGWQAVTYPRYRDERREDHREWRHEERRDGRHDRRD